MHWPHRAPEAARRRQSNWPTGIRLLARNLTIASLFVPGRQGEYDETLRQEFLALFRRLVQLAPRNPDYKFGLAVYPPDVSESSRLIAEAAVLPGAQPEVHEAWSEELLAQGDVARAYKEFMRYLNTDPLERGDAFQAIDFGTRLAEAGTVPGPPPYSRGYSS